MTRAFTRWGDVGGSVILAVALLAIGLLDPAGPYLDSAVYSQVGSTIRMGGHAYVDAWDHKPPGIYAIDAVAQGILQFLSPWAAVWALSVLATGTTLILVAIVLRQCKVDSPIGATLVATAAAMTVYPIAVGGGLAEIPAAAFSVAGLAIVARGGARTWRAMAAGVMVGSACVVNLQAAVAGLAILYLLFEGQGLRSGFAAVGAFLFGGVVVAGLTLLWLWSGGLLPAAFDAVVTYNSAYVQLSRQNIGSTTITQTSLSLGCVACLLLPAMFALKRPMSSSVATRVSFASWIWVGAFALLTIAQGRIAPHYFILAVPPLAILAQPAFEAGLHGLPGTSRRTALSLVVAGFLVTGVVATVTTQRYLTRNPNRDQVRSVAAWLLANTSARSTVFVWGNQPFLYELGRRPPASKYIYMLPLTTPGYSTSEQVAELLFELRTAPPEAFVDAGSSRPGEAGWLPLLIARPVVEVDGRELDILDPVREFVREHYRLAEVVDGWPVYVHDGSSEATLFRTPDAAPIVQPT